METNLATFMAPEATMGYHSAISLEEDLQRLAAARPDIAERQRIGTSVENRPIWALRLGERRGSDRKVLLLGCHRAREWMAVEAPYLLAAHLVHNADQEPVKQWLSMGEIWVTPMVNPDGH